RIEVPTFIAGAWQDEQTGGRFPTMLDRFTSAPLYASLVNGLHTESVSPAVFARMVEFLDLYVAERVPDLSGARAIAPILAAGIFGTDQVELPPDRFTGSTYDEALATFESEPPIHVLFEQGAADGTPPLTPLPRWVEQFDAWPVPGITPTSWWLGDGELLAGPTGNVGSTSYVADPASTPPTFWDGNSSDLWRTDVQWDWVAPPAENVAVYTSEPLPTDLPMVGSGSADLWVSADAADTDLEVTLTEVRADGTEVLVQGGWLRASHRALDEAASSELRPVHTHLEADAEPLVPGGEPVYARVEIFPFAHVFRAGSRIRLAIDAPGGNRPTWEFETISDGETVTVWHGAELGSRLVLPMVDSVVAPAGAPACGSLKGQPCRPDSGGFAAE
nr:CocE/NonD family hydrolase [Ilumatobacteraceae bacterium]